jgi:hypothetical protein
MMASEPTGIEVRPGIWIIGKKSFFGCQKYGGIGGKQGEQLSIKNRPEYQLLPFHAWDGGGVYTWLVFMLLLALLEKKNATPYGTIWN